MLPVHQEVQLIKIYLAFNDSNNCLFKDKAGVKYLFFASSMCQHMYCPGVSSNIYPLLGFFFGLTHSLRILGLKGMATHTGQNEEYIHTMFVAKRPILAV